MKRRIGLMVVFFVTVVICLIVAVAFLLPYLKNPAEMAESTELEIKSDRKGNLEFSWDAGKYVNGYRLEMFDLTAGTETPAYSRFCRRARCTLNTADIPKSGEVLVRIYPRDFLYFLHEDEGEVEEADAVDFTCSLKKPEIKDIVGKVDNEGQKINLTWKGWEGDTYTVYMVYEDGHREEVRAFGNTGGATVGVGELKDFSVSVTYGTRGDFRMPQENGNIGLEMTVTREQEQVTFQGETKEILTMTRQELMSKDIVLGYDRLENNQYRIYWNDTGSLAYLVQILKPGASDFVELARVKGDAELTVLTDHLRAGREYTIRVTALDDKELVEAPAEEAFAKATGTENGERTAPPKGSAEAAFTTEISTLYASVWPMKELDVWSDADKQNAVGKAAAGACLCVLDEDRDRNLFRVSLNDGTEGYIDSNYCMINLPDYLGDLCGYDIPNSYGAIYKVNGFYIPNVTGRVTPGYENILLDDNTFVVPLLYPVAVKLADAAYATLADGYRIEINDSFRPHCATRSIYDETNKVLYWRLPDVRFTSTTFEKFLQNGRALDPPSQSALPQGNMEEALLAQVGEQSAEGDGEGAELAEGAEQAVNDTPVVLSGDSRLTYYWEMTNGSYRLGSFLAAGASRHNIGVAMDLTMVNVKENRKIDTQTEMHNLSWYSAMSRNNVNADILKEYLTAAGFGTISSEWWHFQDDETTKALSPPVVENGVSIEGWKKDDHGWRYRDAKGNYLSGQTIEIDGKEQSFDEMGYVDR